MERETQGARQSQDFKNKMKVSNPLNDIAANLGVTPKVLTQLATGDDQEFRELVRGIFSILPEDEVALVATDTSINPEFLDYLSRLFEDNPRILITILYNSATSQATRKHVLDELAEDDIVSMSCDPKAPPDLLRAIGQKEYESSDIQVNLLANPSTPEDLKEQIIAESSADVEPSELEGINEADLLAPGDSPPESGEVDAKIALCVDKLYDINASIVSEFIRKARAEIIKRLQLVAKANRLVLKTIVKHPAISIEELEGIDMDLFTSLLKKLPEDVDDKTVLKLLKQAKKR
jgi:transcriptional regulator with XRE-family HTH domain